MSGALALRRLSCAVTLCAAASSAAASPPGRVSVGASGVSGASTGPTSTLDARVGLSQLVTDDDHTNQHIAFTQARTTLVSENTLGVAGLSLRADGRARRSWNRRLEHLTDVSRLSLQYDSETSPWLVGVGRQRVLTLFGTRVDGVFVGRRIAEGARAGLFAGTHPHPVTRGFDPRFRSAGLAYDAHGATRHHGGGIVLQLFEADLDRLYLTERLYQRLTDTLTLYGHGIVDALAPRGIMQELRPMHRQGDSRGIDLTNAQVRLLYRPTRQIDASVGAFHTHALIPNRFWQDWLRRERERRGLVEDEEVPVGVRRSSARAAGSLRLPAGLTCFVVARGDYRHNDRRRGSFVRPGIRALVGGDSTLELAYSFRDYHGVRNNRADATATVQIGDGLMLDVRASAMHSRPGGDDEPLMVYDLSAMVHLLLGRWSRSLAGVDAMLQYQGFVEPGLVFHVVYARVQYRYRSGSP